MCDTDRSGSSVSPVEKKRPIQTVYYTNKASRTFMWMLIRINDDMFNSRRGTRGDEPDDMFNSRGGQEGANRTICSTLVGGQDNSWSLLSTLLSLDRTRTARKSRKNTTCVRRRIRLRHIRGKSVVDFYELCCGLIPLLLRFDSAPAAVAV